MEKDGTGMGREAGRKEEGTCRSFERSPASNWRRRGNTRCRCHQVNGNDGTGVPSLRHRGWSWRGQRRRRQFHPASGGRPGIFRQPRGRWAAASNSSTGEKQARVSAASVFSSRDERRKLERQATMAGKKEERRKMENSIKEGKEQMRSLRSPEADTPAQTFATNLPSSASTANAVANPADLQPVQDALTTTNA